MISDILFVLCEASVTRKRNFFLIPFFDLKLWLLSLNVISLSGFHSKKNVHSMETGNLKSLLKFYKNVFLFELKCGGFPLDKWCVLIGRECPLPYIRLYHSLPESSTNDVTYILYTYIGFFEPCHASMSECCCQWIFNYLSQLFISSRHPY